MIDPKWTAVIAALPHRFRLSERSTLLLLAVAVGLAVGFGVWVFDSLIEGFHLVFQEWLTHEVLAPVFGPLAVIVTLALVGLLVGWLMQRFVGLERHHGLAGVIEAVALAGGRLPYRLMPVKTLAAALSLGAGASVGPEAPSVVIGAHIGSFFGQRLRLSEERMRLLVAAGASSAIAAAFRAPLAGVFFGIEVILNGEFTTGSFGVVVLASVISSVFTQAITGGGAVLGRLSYTLGSPAEIVLYAILGLLLAPVAVAFIHTVHWQQELWQQRVYLSRPLKTALAGLIVGAVAIFLPQVMGPGRGVIALALSAVQPADYTVGLLLALGGAKLLLTAVSLAGGFVGGIFAPSLFIGAMFGGAFGQVVSRLLPFDLTGSPQAFAIAGMAAVMAGVVRAPITGILMVFELTNDYRLILPIMFTTAICMVLTERLVPAGMDGLALLKKGVRLQQGRDVDILQGITVGETMTTPAPTISERASLADLRDQLHRQHTRSLCVTDDSGQLVGIVTLTDLQNAFAASGVGSPFIVGDICTRDVITAAPDDVLWTAVRSMGARDIGSLPVVRPGSRQVVGLLSRSGVMQAYGLAVARKREQQRLAEQIRLNALTGAQVIELHVCRGALADGQTIAAVGWPEASVIASVRRRGRLIVPHGSTRLQAGDTLAVIAAPEALDQVARLCGYETAGEG